MYSLGSADDHGMYRMHLVCPQLPDLHNIAPLLVISGIMPDQIIYRENVQLMIQSRGLIPNPLQRCNRIIQIHSVLFSLFFIPPK